MRFRFVASLLYRPQSVFLGMLMASVSIVPAHAIENVRREARHFFECLGFMIGSPAVHEENCLPNRVPGPLGSIQSTGGGGVVSAPVVAPPAPPAAPPACVCGACYAI